MLAQNAMLAGTQSSEIKNQSLPGFRNGPKAHPDSDAAFVFFTGY